MEGEELSELVSIIIPAYNAAQTLERAVQSVLSQDYGPMEIIVVDDGSTDGTVDVVRGYGEKVRLIQQENRGAGAARNRGVAKARGEYIAFLDADDEYLPGRLRKGIEPMLADDCVAITHCQCILCYPDEHRVVDGVRFKQMALFLSELLVDPLYATTPGVTMRRSVFEKSGGFDESFLTREDHDLWMRVHENYPVKFINEPLVVAHKQEGSVSRSRSTQGKVDDLERLVMGALERKPEYYAPERELILAHLHWHMGMLYLGGGEYRLARWHFRRARGFKKHWKLSQLIALTYLPGSFLRFVRRFLRR